MAACAFSHGFPAFQKTPTASPAGPSPSRSCLWGDVLAEPAAARRVAKRALLATLNGMRTREGNRRGLSACGQCLWDSGFQSPVCVGEHCILRCLLTDTPAKPPTSPLPALLEGRARSAAAVQTPRHQKKSPAAFDATGPALWIFSDCSVSVQRSTVLFQRAFQAGRFSLMASQSTVVAVFM